MTTKRLALLLESDGPGGAESVVVTLAQGLRTRGIEVFPVVFAPGQGWMSGQLLEEGFPLFQPRLSRPFDPAFVVELARWFRHRGIGHAHAHEFTMGFYAGAAARLAGVPHTLTMHGGLAFAKATRRRVALSLTAHQASAVVGVSESTCEHLANSLWMNRNRVSMVPNGIRSREGERMAARAALQIEDHETLLVAVGNLYEVKGHRFLIEAAALLKAKPALPPWKIVIAGRGDEREHLVAQISANDLHQQVQLLGLRNDIPDLLAAADGWVMPSLSEGLPMALLEAMFARLPVICSSVGGIPKLVEPASSGWLVRPGQADELAAAIEELLVNPQRRRIYGRRGRELAEQSYGQMTMVDRYLNLYQWKR